MAVSRPAALDPSVLGTKEHWDDVYRIELSNHSEDAANEGAVWFEDTGAEERMIAYLADLPLFQAHSAGTKPRVLDLGTGNGHLLFTLRDEGFEADLLGIDYSEESVVLARQIGEARRAAILETEGSHAMAPVDISFRVWDLLRDETPPWLSDGFDVVLDKGTFDAISLSDTKDAHGRTGFETYSERVRTLMKPESYLLVTSCNWTSEELAKWIEIPGLVVYEDIEYASFTFGGVKGQAVSTVCFKSVTPD